MTKQEQIEEMVNIMAASNNPFVDVPIEIMPNAAEALYNADYRKADEIRKETVKEIYDLGSKETEEKIFKMLISKLDSNQFLSGKRIIMEVDVENLAKQFDVEI